MKTLVLSEVFPPRTGGSGRWLHELYRRWPASQVSVLAGGCAAEAAFDRAQPLPISRMPLTFESWGLVGYRNVRQYTAAYRHVAAEVKRQQITEIHCGRVLPEGFIAWMVNMRHRVPYACYIHGEELNTAGTSRELAFLARRVLKGARVLIANSVNTARVLMHQWSVPAAQIEVLHPGVDAARFAPVESDAAARDQLGWRDRRVILTVGRLQARKGHARMIQALPQIVRRIPGVLYAIAGEGEMRAQLQAMTQSLSLGHHVAFLGELDDDALLTCMQQCDLFALPNIEVAGDFEGFGMVLVEAQACGKAVIAGRSGGTSETMREGETGRLVDCTDESELAAVTGELLRSDAVRAAMGRAGRRWVERRFDWAMLARESQAIFAQRFGRAAPIERKAA